MTLETRERTEAAMTRMVDLGFATRTEDGGALELTPYGIEMANTIDPMRMGRILRGDDDPPEAATPRP